MGIEKENWPATVSLFTGLFAKEAVVGTLNSLYVQESAADDAAGGAASGWALAPIFGEAFIALGENLAGIFSGLADPLGTGMINGDETATGENWRLVKAYLPA